MTMDNYKPRRIYTVEVWRRDDGRIRSEVHYFQTYSENIALVGRKPGLIGIMLCNSKREAEEIARTQNEEQRKDEQNHE